MEKKIFERDYFTFEESLQKLGVRHEDFVAALASQKLRPSIWSKGLLKIYEWEDDGLGGSLAPVPDDDGLFELMERKEKWVYLREPEFEGPGALTFSVASSTRDAMWPRSGDSRPYAEWFVCPDPYAIQDLIQKGVFLRQELISYEACTNSREDAEIVEVADEPDLPVELDAALVVYRLLKRNGGGSESTFKKSAISEIRKMCPEFTAAAVERVATVINIDTAPGKKPKK